MDAPVDRQSTHVSRSQGVGSVITLPTPWDRNLRIASSENRWPWDRKVHVALSGEPLPPQKEQQPRLPAVTSHRLAE
jgi:hypothetical protein